MLFHPNPTSYILDSDDFGALGHTIVGLSNLEFAHDHFVFLMYERNRSLSARLSNRFPRHFREKTDFLIHAIAHVQRLRQIPIFPTGELNLLWLQYQLDELYEIRSIIAHGSIFLTEKAPDRITWTFDRFVTRKRNTWTHEAVKMTNGFLASVHWTATTLKHYIMRLSRCLENDSCWESDYQADKEIRRNRKCLAEFVANGIVVDHDGLFDLFPPLGQIE